MSATNREKGKQARRKARERSKRDATRHHRSKGLPVAGHTRAAADEAAYRRVHGPGPRLSA